jgi:hypothetical protein
VERRQESYCGCTSKGGTVGETRYGASCRIDLKVEGGENYSSGPLSDGDLAFSLGFDTLKNLKQARASLQEAAQRQGVRNALLTRPHEYAVGDEVLLPTENIVLWLPSRKFSPKFVGPFRILEPRGKNAVKIQLTGRFKALHDIVNVEYLRPYNNAQRMSDLPLIICPSSLWLSSL